MPTLTNVIINNWVTTCDFQLCDILTSVDLDELVQPPFKLRNANGVRSEA